MVCARMRMLTLYAVIKGPGNVPLASTALYSASVSKIRADITSCY
jgi:hypothetical protein